MNALANSTAQSAAAWGEAVAQTYAINDNIVYRHAINNANAHAKGIQTIAQAQKFNKTNTNSQSKRASITKQARAYHTAWQGRGLLSLSLVGALFLLSARQKFTKFAHFTRKFTNLGRFFLNFTQKFTNSALKFKNFTQIFIYFFSANPHFTLVSTLLPALVEINFTRKDFR